MTLMEYVRNRARADAEAATEAAERAQMVEALNTLGVKTEEESDDEE